MPTFFPMWVVVTHFLNIFLMVLMFRSGIEVLSAFPKLYWYDDCPPGREWLRLSKKMYAADSSRPWSSMDEEESWSPMIALPGRRNLGLGRHWHFMTVPFWIVTGGVYVVLVFATGYWHYLVPTHWSIVADSIRAVGTYLHFQLPAKIPGEPFEPAQKLAYFTVVFLLAPLQIATGAAMSPRFWLASRGTAGCSAASRVRAASTSWGCAPSRCSLGSTYCWSSSMAYRRSSPRSSSAIPPATGA